MNESEELLHEHTEELKAAAADFKQKACEAATVAWDLTREKCRTLEERAMSCSKAADKAVRDHAYMSLGIAMAAGLLIGLLAGNQSCCAEDPKS